MEYISMLKKGCRYFPEVLLILLSIYWFLDGINTQINYFAIGLFAIVSTLVLWKNKALAILLAALLGLGSLWMILAVWSEYLEFPKGSPEGVKLLVIGMFIFLVSFACAIVMPVKYLKKTVIDTIYFELCYKQLKCLFKFLSCADLYRGN